MPLNHKLDNMRQTRRGNTPPIPDPPMPDEESEGTGSEPEPEPIRRRTPQQRARCETPQR
jgi:hypothetical protein